MTPSTRLFLPTLMIVGFAGCTPRGSSLQVVEVGTTDAGDSNAGVPDAGENDAGENDAGENDAGVPDGGAPCLTDLDCDDGNPRTSDFCYILQGLCFHRECFRDSDCNDNDPNTVDVCHQVLGSISTVCQHPLLPGRCHIIADCDDGLACSTESCVANICRYSVPVSCVVACEPYPPCGPQDVIGAPCGSLPVARSDCLAAGGACPEVHLCGNSFYASYAAGPACPSSFCPATPPLSGSACGSTDLRCDYGIKPSERCSTWNYGPTTLSGSAFSGTHPPGHPMCECRAGLWYCTTEYCPLSPPYDGEPFVDPTGAFWGSAICLYNGNLRCGLGLTPPTYQTFGWRCFYPRPCPSPAPANGAGCDRTQDDWCSYVRSSGAEPVTQYNGVCLCGTDGSWHCDPNGAADCPAQVPAPEPALWVACTRSTGNQQCLYYDGTSRTLTFSCGCNGLWQCARQGP